METNAKLRADVLTEFLEVAFHSILHLRSLYPSQIFALKRKYQIPVRVSKHPRVNEYLNECLTTIRDLLETDSVKEVSLVVLSDDEPVERFVFAIRLKGTPPSDDYLVAVEEMFRQFLLKLTVLDSSLRRLPTDCTFAVHVTTRESSFVRLNESVRQANFPWVESEEGERSSLAHRIVPVKSAECSMFGVSAYLER